MAKQPTCHNCKGTGTIHIENWMINRPVDMPCWVCGGSNFKGMNQKQVAWYLAQHSQLEVLQTTLFSHQKITDLPTYDRIRAAIDKACRRLGIAQQPITFQHSTQYGTSSEYLTLRGELKEYERRLTAIPTTIAAR